MGLPETSKFLDTVEATEGFSVSYDDNCGGASPGIVTIDCKTGHSLEVGVECAVRDGLNFVASHSTLNTLSGSWDWFHRQRSSFRLALVPSGDRLQD